MATPGRADCRPGGWRKRVSLWCPEPQRPRPAGVAVVEMETECAVALSLGPMIGHFGRTPCAPAWPSPRCPRHPRVISPDTHVQRPLRENSCDSSRAVFIWCEPRAAEMWLSPRCVPWAAVTVTRSPGPRGQVDGSLLPSPSSPSLTLTFVPSPPLMPASFRRTALMSCN